MSFIKTLTVLLLTSIIAIAITCDSKCPKGNLRLSSGSRNWLPLKGKTHLAFVDKSGKATNYYINVVDTLQAYTKQIDCSGDYFYEYISVVLYLNASKTDSIRCTMASGSSLSLRADSDRKYSIGYGNLLNQSSTTSSKTRFSSLKIGSRTYSNVILATSQYSDNYVVDSIYLAYNYGIIGFNYHGDNYFFKMTNYIYQ